MAADFSKGFYNSSLWKKCRNVKIAQSLGLCEMCKKPGYIVHHKIHLTPENINNPEVTLSLDNLEYLCLD